MAVEMRERPIVTGRDADKFLEKVGKNNLALSRRIAEKAIGKSIDERREVYKHLRSLHKNY